MKFLIVKPCKAGAYDIIPKKIVNVDLESSGKKIATIGYKEVCDAGVMLVVKKDVEVHIYPNGKLLIKTNSKKEAEGIANRIYEALEL